MGQSPAHSTHSDQQSVDLCDCTQNRLKIFINYIAVGVEKKQGKKVTESNFLIALLQL